MEKTVRYTPVDLHWKWHQRMHWESSTRCCLAKVTQKPLLQWSETQSEGARATVECGPPCRPGSELRSWQAQCHLSLWLVSCRGLQTERIVLQWLLETGVERGVGGVEWEMGGHRSLHVTVMWLLWNYCYCNIMWHDIYVRPSETKTTMTHMLSCDCHVTCIAIMWLSCDLWPSCDSCCYHVTVCDYHVTVMWSMLLSCDCHVTTHHISKDSALLLAVIILWECVWVGGVVMMSIVATVFATLAVSGIYSYQCDTTDRKHHTHNLQKWSWMCE